MRHIFPTIHVCTTTRANLENWKVLKKSSDGYLASNAFVLLTSDYFRVEQQKHIVDKCNSIYKVQMPRIASHVSRHTYCSNMAKSGINPKTLQYLMGHAEMSTRM